MTRGKLVNILSVAFIVTVALGFVIIKYYPNAPRNNSYLKAFRANTLNESQYAIEPSLRRFVSENCIKYSENGVEAGKTCFKTHRKTFSQSLLLTSSSAKKVTSDNVKDFVFVTASSDNHFTESLGAIKSVQKYYPSKILLYYDIGLSSSNVAKLKTFCNVKYRTFDYAKYGEHTRKPLSYAFKPLIIQEVLSESFGVYWLDSSARIRCNKSRELVSSEIVRRRGLYYPHHTGHSIRAATHPTLFQYLPPRSMSDMGEVEMAGASILMLYRTPTVWNHVIYWWAMCADDPSCTDISGAKIYCSSADIFNKPDQFSGCHRYDQSALAILAHNAGVWDAKRGAEKNTECWEVVRGVDTRIDEIKTCKQ